MAKTSKKVKTKTYKFFGLNIKLQSNEREGEEAYIDLITEAYKKSEPIRVGGERAIMFKSMFEKELIFKRKKHSVLYGKLVRFTLLESENWYFLNEKELGPYEVPKDRFPNGFECDYVFIPVVHRFYFAISKLSPNIVSKFLYKSLKNVAGLREEIVINLIQSSDTFEQIINASSLLSLDIRLTYTNADIGGPAKELIDRLLKESNSGVVDTSLRPDHNEQLNAQSDYITGMLELARENGEARATIKNDFGRKTIIKTINHPEKRPVTVKEGEDPYTQIFNDVMKDKTEEDGASRTE